MQGDSMQMIAFQLNVAMETRLGKGDNTVILQSMSYDRMANALFSRVGQGDNTGITGGSFGTSVG
jgi:hypothetical protein